MSLMPAVRASLAERFIFNFRLPAKALARYLPVPWLAPQEVRGYGVASFCILDLRGITVAPLTTQIGLTSISCAPRYAVLDVSREQATPAVFVTERQTNSAFGAWFTALGILCASSPSRGCYRSSGRSNIGARRQLGRRIALCCDRSPLCRAKVGVVCVATGVCRFHRAGRQQLWAFPARFTPDKGRFAERGRDLYAAGGLKPRRHIYGGLAGSSWCVRQRISYQRRPLRVVISWLDG
jgi:hypothetical protein